MAKVKGPGGTHQETGPPGKTEDPKEKQLPMTGRNVHQTCCRGCPVDAHLVLKIIRGTFSYPLFTNELRSNLTSIKSEKVAESDFKLLSGCSLSILTAS